jgi:Tfp pilus assembly protein PilN
MHLNLLPPSFRFKLLMRTSLRRWSLIWGTALGCAFAYCSLQSREVFDAANRMATLDVQCQPLRNLEQDATVQQERLAHLQAERQILEQLQPDEHSLQLLGLLAQAARRTRGKVQLQRLSYVAPAYPTSVAISPARQASEPPSAATALEAPQATLSLQGLADDDDALAGFVATLREEGIFQRVELKASSQLRTPNGSDRQYQLECRF